MNQIVNLRTEVDRPFTPTGFHDRQAKIEGLIAYAKRAKEWQMLEDAVTLKIEDQEELVRWWTENVSRNWGGNRNKYADRGTCYISMEEAEELSGIIYQQVARWRKSLKDKEKYRHRLLATERRAANLTPSENHRARGTGDNDWFTPATYIEAAREVMGSIDLDPASHAIAQRTVQATEFCTPDNDGLKRPWSGRVWLNPPYSQPEIGMFVDKLVASVAAHMVDQAILLTHNYTDTGWFHNAEKLASLICFTRGRIRFIDADDEECSPTQGQAFFYFGKEAERFRDIFSNFGFVR